MNTDNEEYDSQSGSSGRNGPVVWLILFFAVAIGTAIFILQNGERVPAEFLWFDRSIKLWVAIVVSVGLGVLLDRLILTWWRRGRRRKHDNEGGG
jgi:uncharacterized integral membrane protein